MLACFSECCHLSSGRLAWAIRPALKKKTQIRQSDHLFPHLIQLLHFWTALISTLGKPGDRLPFAFVGVIYECELMYRWHAQQHFGPKAKGHGQCQGGSTSLCLPKCGAVVHFGVPLLRAFPFGDFRWLFRCWPGTWSWFGVVVSIHSKPELWTPDWINPSDPGQQCIMTRSLIMCPPLPHPLAHLP